MIIQDIVKSRLEGLYHKYNRREFVHPDPIEFLYDYNGVHEREIVALVASSLAYGRVEQILKSVSSVIERMPEPFVFLRRASLEMLYITFRDFRHRFTTGEDLAHLLFGAKKVIEKYGSLNACFSSVFDDNDSTVFPALLSFVNELTSQYECTRNTLIPLPEGGSSFKRFNLFLRWMVRRDDVDPGGWSGVPASKLIVPLDTHLHRICLALNLTERKQADARTACEITSAFRAITPDDPVRYDFVLARMGIWGRLSDILSNP
ncbi:TIGR02757 family protein [bacterium]|nr:TIGR02757 family protein [bacterium]